MEKRFVIQQAVVVEGKYDKIKLASLLDAPILTVGGFSIFKDRAMQALLRSLARERGLVILTDSDVAGFRIRQKIVNCVGGAGEVIHAYIPDRYGTERRKTAPSKEGKLGVEGMPAELILRALAEAGVLSERKAEAGRPITHADLYADGLSGGTDSRKRRQAVIRRLDLPEHLSTSGLLTVLNALLGYDRYRALLEELFPTSLEKE